ncbi:hypothetical protein D3C84_949380 [compost metagenome]
MTQPVITHGAVVALNIGILLRITRLNVFQADTLFFGPQRQLRADVLRAVIAADGLWFTPPLNHLLQCAHHSLGR